MPHPKPDAMSTLSMLAARAIDAKCRLNDSYSLLTMVEQLQSKLPDDQLGRTLVSMLLLSESTDPEIYLFELRRMERLLDRRDGRDRPV